MPLDFAGFPGTYLPSAFNEIVKPRAASYQTGIAMLAGQHKGEALKDLLNRIRADDEYDFIILFDDDEKNVDAVWQSFLADQRTAVVFLCNAVDTPSMVSYHAKYPLFQNAGSLTQRVEKVGY